jgi:hypothetical protein
MFLTDGKGRGYNAAINERNELQTQASTMTEIARHALMGKAFCWTASVNVGADANVIWLRNDSETELLVIDTIVVSCSAASNLEIYVSIIPATVPTPGTAVLGVNMLVGHHNVAPATCYHTETSVNAGAGLTLFSTHQTAITSKEQIDYKGALALPYLGEVALNNLTNVDLTSVNILGYFRVID